MVLNSQLLYGLGYAQGAPVTTSGKTMWDGKIDKLGASFAKEVRQQTHWLNVNTTDIPSMVSSMTSKTVGISVNTQVESPHATFNQQAEDFIEEFGLIGVGELTGKHHFNSALRAISDFDLLDGGVIIRHHYNTAWTIPYKYELVGVDMIDISKTDTFSGANEKTLSGIVLNKWNQITHLWLYKSDDKMYSEKVPFKNLTYYSDVWISVGQQVAVSKLASILPTLDSIDQYATAELNAAIESAKAGHFIKSTAYDEIMKIAYDEIDKLSTLEDKVVEFKAILQDLAKVGIGQYGTSPIPASDEVQFNSATRDGVYSDLNGNSEMKMSSALGMSDIGVYSKAKDANYSSIKYVSETDRLSTSIRWDNISNKIVKEIHSRLIRVGIQIGTITERAAYWKSPGVFTKFRYLRRLNIDIEPAKTATANEKNLQLGIKTEAQIIEERDGVKYETYLKKKFEQDIMKEQMRIKMYADAGIPLPDLAPAPTKEDVKNTTKALAQFEEVQ